jgi:ferrochelatase
MGKIMKRAVILFNLGGPDSLKAVRPFLFNLFYDPYILSVPRPLRYLLARLISWRRAPVAQEIYKKMGGESPILKQTKEQAFALEKVLGGDTRVFTVMRYWHPRAEDVYQEVLEYAPDEVVLLPLYPQYSTTTSLSSLKEWSRIQNWEKAPWQTRVIRSYPTLSGVVDYYAREISFVLSKIPASEKVRILFSAHGLPEKVIAAGDPYQKHILETAFAIEKRLPTRIEARVTYQSRVGPLKWLDPYTDREIEQAGHDQCHLILVPLAFVSEHSETLVELDIEYKELANNAGVLSYHRIRTPEIDCGFIESLANLVRETIDHPFVSGRFPCVCWQCPKKLNYPKTCCLSRYDGIFA